MRNETEMLRKRVIREGAEGAEPVAGVKMPERKDVKRALEAIAPELGEYAGRAIWIRGQRPGSWAFVCNLCGEISYFPQNTRVKDPDGAPRVVMGYRYCPYCRTEMKGIATVRAKVGAHGERRPDDWDE